MKRFLFLIMVFMGTICGAQVPISFQGFEESDSWSYTTYPAFYDYSQNGDVFAILNAPYQTMFASSGSSYLAMQDLENPNGNPPYNGNYYHYLTFSAVAIPQPIPSDLMLSFNYLVHEFDGSDFLAYEVQFDDDSTWYSNWLTSVDTSYEFSEYLSKNTDDQYVNYVIDIPDTVTHVRFRVGAKQNGGNDWASVDDVLLFFNSGDFVSPSVSSTNIINDHTILVSFDEPLTSVSVSLEDYTVESTSLNQAADELTISLTNPLLDGDYFNLYIDSAIDSVNNETIDTLYGLVHNDFIGNLVITEINYNDPGTYDNLEYFEIYNNGSETYPLGGLEFNEGISITFPEHDLAAGDYVVVAKAAFFFSDACGALPHGCGFQSYFGFAPDFEIASGNLSNGGEDLICVNTNGDQVIFVDYDDANGWPENADGYGYSISLCDPSADPNDPSNWSLSASLQSAIDQSESTLSALGMTGYPQYYSDPGQGCPEGDIVPPAVASVFALNSDTVVVLFNEEISVAGSFDGLNIIDSDLFGDTVILALEAPLTAGQENNIVVTATQDMAGNYIDTTNISFYFNDSQPNLIITEIMYDDPGYYDNLEFIEVYNHSDFDAVLGGLIFTDGIDFTFPEGILESGNRIIISRTPYSGSSGGCDTLNYGCGFQEFFGFAPDYQWLSTGSSLSGAEDITIENTVGDVLSYVNYNNIDPWPNAFGTGYSIQFCDLDANNNDPTMWSLSSTSQGSYLGTAASDILTEVFANPSTDGCIAGCMDSLALNYDANAQVNDESCEYPQTVLGCTDSTA